MPEQAANEGLGHAGRAREGDEGGAEHGREVEGEARGEDVELAVGEVEEVGQVAQVGGRVEAGLDVQEAHAQGLQGGRGGEVFGLGCGRVPVVELVYQAS